MRVLHQDLHPKDAAMMSGVCGVLAGAPRPVFETRVCAAADDIIGHAPAAEGAVFEPGEVNDDSV